jgi:hypothetical protein
MHFIKADRLVAKGSGTGDVPDRNIREEGMVISPVSGAPDTQCRRDAKALSPP